MLQVNPSTARYVSRRGEDAELHDGIERVSRERRRSSCRRLHAMITREGFEGNHKKGGGPARNRIAGAPQRRAKAGFGHEEADGTS